MTQQAEMEQRVIEAPRNDLAAHGLTPMRAEEGGNTLVGYPIVFNQWTEINSWEGHFLERVLPSGPVQFLKGTANRQRVKVQYNHGMSRQIESSPLGKPRRMDPDDFGVYTETPLSQTWYNRDIIKPLLLDGALDGMSFRFSVIEDKWERPTKATAHNPDKLPERSLVEFKVHEFGPVDWPAYEAAQAGIRSVVAFDMWQNTPVEQRAAILQRHNIALPPEERRRLWVPGWDPPRCSSPLERMTNSPADIDVTDDETSEPAETTRALDDATEAPVTPYQPVQPPAMTAERREARRGLVKAWVAQSQRSA